jgi:hypothetical protein
LDPSPVAYQDVGATIWLYQMAVIILFQDYQDFFIAWFALVLHHRLHVIE